MAIAAALTALTAQQVSDLNDSAYLADVRRSGLAFGTLLQNLVSGVNSTGQGAGQVPSFTIASNTEDLTIASAAVAINTAKLIHRVAAAGTGTITTLTGGVEGMIAILMLAVAGVTVTATATDTANTIHFTASGTGIVAAPTSVVTTNLTALIPKFITLLFTANMPGFAAAQWFEVTP